MTDRGAPTSLRGGVSRILSPLAALALLIAGCGGGDRITQTRQVAPFDRLDVADSVDLEVVPGDGRDVRVYGGEDVLDRVETESSGGVLRVDIRDRGIVLGPDPLGDVRVQVAASELDAVRIGGSSDVELGGLDLPELELEIEGAGEVEASGSADRLNATIQGAGDARLSELAVRTATVVVQGAGAAHVNVSERLDVKVQGAADVVYRGHPEVTQDIDGAGEVRREGS
jgi:Putative auto-transporter adhesin, head GIN domain